MEVDQVSAKFLTSSSVSNANSEKEGTFISKMVAETDSRTALVGDWVLAASLDLIEVMLNASWSKFLEFQGDLEKTYERLISHTFVLSIAPFGIVAHTFWPLFFPSRNSCKLRMREYWVRYSRIPRVRELFASLKQEWEIRPLRELLVGYLHHL